MINRKCKCGCGKSINHKHPNAKFYNQKHKDNFWNKENEKEFNHVDEYCEVMSFSDDMDLFS